MGLGVRVDIGRAVLAMVRGRVRAWLCCGRAYLCFHGDEHESFDLCGICVCFHQSGGRYL